MRNTIMGGITKKAVELLKEEHSKNSKKWEDVIKSEEFKELFYELVEDVEKLKMLSGHNELFNR
jgi:hypothetical protein